MRIPIATSPGRGGFQPELSLAYDSGKGNGPFGIGWELSVPQVRRKTTKGVPRYRGEDTYVLSGAEDLAPMLVPEGDDWVPATSTEEREVGGERRIFEVQRFRPRVEGLFARIERWRDRDSAQTHWRSISKDNRTTIYGRSAGARISDPEDPSRVFTWLIEETRDDKGNVLEYEYAKENREGVEATLLHERNRLRSGTAFANRYLKRIHYGNRVPDPEADDDWMFEVVFDYGDHAAEPGGVEPDGTWDTRPDPFSTYRAGFEVRTYRRCRRVLLFHRFPGSELGDAPRLVRSTEFEYDTADDGRGPSLSYLQKVQLHGYAWDSERETYTHRSFPPLELDYHKPRLHRELAELDAEDLEPAVGTLLHRGGRWTDLDGEGLSGILSEQGGRWYYRRNGGRGRFGRVEPVDPLPAPAAVAGGREQLLDLAGDGQTDLVELGATAGFYERRREGSWEPFRALESVPTVDWDDPNLRFVDLDGDGLSDILLTEQDAFVWYPSRGEEGFGPGRRVPKVDDEEDGPTILFADASQSVYLADMAGDGLTDLVRIRNGEVCYWPSLGHGRFGAKVTMDDAPMFDHPDLFKQSRIRLADIDGSGTTDILYVNGDSVDVWFNQSGNGWGERCTLENLPTMDDRTVVSAVDVFGQGTACLVWSSPLPGDAVGPARCLDLMSGEKPHLLRAVRNSLGAETAIEYAPSTRYYLADREAGRPWITRLPFPVHVVAKVTKHDRITGNRLVTTYDYHHGYFDGEEREFRGFGRVEQQDAETVTHAGTSGSGAAEPDEEEELRLPPVRTVSWFHTGAYIDRRRIARLYADEYYNGDEDAALLPDTVLPAALKADEEREAARALKGRLLRQEVYAEDASSESGHPYTVTETSYALRRLQPRADQRHAVFHAYQQQSLAYHYERRRDDPRLTQSLNLAVDDFGNVTESVSVAYPRRAPRIAEQERPLVSFMEAQFINKPDEPDFYRIGLPYETRTYELTGLGSAGRAFDPRRPLVTIGDLQQLSDAVAGAEVIPYEREPSGEVPQKRLIERERVLYRRNDLSGPLPRREVESLALPWETYRQVFTTGLLDAVYGDRVDDELLADAGYVQFPEDSDGGWWLPSGRQGYAPPGEELPAGMTRQDFARDHFYLPVSFTDPFDNTTRVRRDVYLLLLADVTDPAGNVVRAENDYRTLQPERITDPNGNRSQVAFDALGLVVATAVMGEEEGSATGDNLEGIVPDRDRDAVSALLDSDDPETGAHGLLGEATTRLVYDLWRYHDTRDDPQPQPNVVWTISRDTHVSDLGDGERPRLQHLMVYSDGFGREILSKARAEPGPTPARAPDTGELMTEGDRVLWTDEADGVPDITDPRWVGTGRTVYDNKGNPVKKYEPFFSDTHRYEDEAKLVHWGVTPILRRDPLGRVVRTDNPDSTFSRVGFDPWRQETWDESDTVLESDWYRAPGRDSPGRDLPSLPSDPERRAAALAAEHAETPTSVHLDVLGRPVLSVAHNREVRRNLAGAIREIREQRIPTRTEVDAKGQPLLVRDARHIEEAPDPDPLTYTAGNPVMEYRLRRDGPGSEILAPGYDLAGRQLYQRSMDAGERWTLPDVAGDPLRTWDSRGHRLRYEYDALRRRTHLFVRDAEGEEVLAERTVYGESISDDDERRRRNLSGQVYLQCDGAGLVENEAFDVKGNLLSTTRRLAVQYRDTPDWNPANWEAVEGALAESTLVRGDVLAPLAPLLEAESFTASTTYDALNRPTASRTPDDSVTRTAYNEAGLLENLDVRVRGADMWTPFVRNIDYNEIGQRTAIEYGNDVTTEYEYDAKTFRLRQLRSTRDHAPRRVQDLTYTYDPVGNITEIRDDAQQTVYFDNSEVSPSNNYIYDGLYRLTRAQGREHAGQNIVQRDSEGFEALMGIPFPNSPEALQRYTEEYRYDSVGNIEIMRHAGGGVQRWNRRYRYAEDSNRLLGTNLPGDDADEFSAGYTYNAHGSMTAMPHLPEISWDFKEQMRWADLGGGGTVYFTYDASGQRARKVHEHNGSTVKERVYLGGFEIYRHRNSSGPQIERETLHVMDDQQRIALVETTTREDGDEISDLSPVYRYQLNNHLGSSVVELDRDGVEISYEDYHPYGTTATLIIRSRPGVSLKRYRYTGKERDEETGLYYYGFRYYQSWLGRWTSSDPFGLTDGINRYSYTNENPVRFTDIRGADSHDVIPVNERPEGWEFLKPGAVFAHGTEALGELGSEEDVLEAAQEAGVPVFRFDPENPSAVSFEKAEKRAKALALGRSLGEGLNLERSQGSGERSRPEPGGSTEGASTGKAGSAGADPDPDAAFATEKDVEVTIAGILQFESGSDEGTSGGLPGGMNPEAEGSETLQNLYLGLSVLGAVGGAAKAGFGLLKRGGRRALRSLSGRLSHRINLDAGSLERPQVPLPAPGESALDYGTRVHQEFPRIVSETNPSARGRFNVAPGRRGPDLGESGNPEAVSGLNATFGELKSIWDKQNRILRQARRWGHDPQTGRYFFYDRNTGFVFEGVFQTEKFPSGRFR